MNFEPDMDPFEIHLDTFMDTKVPLRRYITSRKWSADRHVIGQFLVNNIYNPIDQFRSNSWFWQNWFFSIFDLCGQFEVHRTIYSNRRYTAIDWTDWIFVYERRTSERNKSKTSEFWETYPRIILRCFFYLNIDDVIGMIHQKQISKL